MSVPSSFNVPTPSQTASLASSYVPPLAGSSASRTAAFTPSAARPSAANPNPSTPALQDDHQWITAYLNIHQLSSASYRYMYILWLAVVLVFLVFAVLHWTGRRGGAIGGFWSRWSLRRRTWRKQHSLAEARRRNKPHKQPLSLPSNAQLLSIAVLYIITLLLCFLGPDYIAPGTHVWDLSNTRRDVSHHWQPRAAPIPKTSATSQPAYTIPKAWWTSGGRTGIMAFSLFPLCVLFALKSPPFALFALPFLIQIYNDKLAFIHRWSGRLIWFVTALHVALWGVQLARDKRGFKNPASVWNFAFEYDKFVYGWLGFICLTLLVALSVRPVRVEFYEIFYILHVLLVPLTLIFSALHFPPVGWWCWATLVLWGAERLWRIVRFVRINGIIGSSESRRNIRYVASMNEKASGWAKPNDMQINLTRRRMSATGHVRDDSHTSHATQDSVHQLIPPSEMDVVDVTDPRRISVYARHPRPLSTGEETIKSFRTGSSVDLIPHAAAPGIRPDYSPSQFPPTTPDNVRSAFQPNFAASSRRMYLPPPGYAHAVLLPGRTIRLRLITPRHFSWAPGQHVLLNLPSVSKLTSHPFTIASVCDEEATSDEGREVVILVRAKSGFTRDLWTHVERLEASGQVGDTPLSNFAPPKRGVLLRAYVDGPFGSSVRTRWTSYSTVLVIAGGSGVSFAMAVLEFACMCVAGRDGRHLGGRPWGLGHNSISQIDRVRFVWIVREFSHIQWAASTIRRCMDMVPSAALQVEIFVTNVAMKPRPALALDMLTSHGNDGTLAPPTPNFLRSGKSRRNSFASDTSLESGISENTFADVSYMQAPQAEAGDANQVTDIVDMYGDLGHEEHVLDLTNFDGEDDSALPGETQFSHQLRKEGKLRREITRKSQGARLAKHELEQRHAEIRPPAVPNPYSAHTSKHPPPGFRPPTPPKDGLQTPTSSTTLRMPVFHDPLTPTGPGETLFTPITPHSPQPNAFLYADHENKSRSVSPAPSNTTESVPRFAPYGQARSKFDMDELESEDMPIVAERARPGRAKIDRILADEAGRSKGAMVVACCGPTSLAAMVRKTVAAHINPSRILRGDMRASIALVSEDFEW